MFGVVGFVEFFLDAGGFGVFGFLVFVGVGLGKLMIGFFGGIGVVGRGIFFILWVCW